MVHLRYPNHRPGQLQPRTGAWFPVVLSLGPYTTLSLSATAIRSIVLVLLQAPVTVKVYDYNYGAHQLP